MTLEVYELKTKVMNDTKAMMACGHAANAVQVRNDGTKIPACAICSCTDIVDTPSFPEGREAKCTDCGRSAPSHMRLPFFAVKPNEPFDSYYCGCRGWD